MKCEHPTKDNKPCQNDISGENDWQCGVKGHKRRPPNGNDAMDSAAVQNATADAAVELATARENARIQLERLCRDTIKLDGLQYGVYGEPSVDLNELRNIIALVQHCKDEDLYAYDASAEKALIDVGYLVQIEEDAKDILDGDTESTRRAASYILSQFAGGKGLRAARLLVAI